MNRPGSMVESSSTEMRNMYDEPSGALLIAGFRVKRGTTSLPDSRTTR